MTASTGSADFTSSALRQRALGLDASTLADADRSLRVLPAALRPLGSHHRLVGRAVTADAHADLMSVVAALNIAQAGDVLVIANCSPDRAMAGELFATEALRRGVTGMIIDGLSRDSAVVAGLPLPVFTRGVTPWAAPAVAVPVVQVPVTIGGVTIRPGDWLIGDADGIVVADETALLAALDRAEAHQAREDTLRTRISDGGSLFDRSNFAAYVDDLRAGRTGALSFYE